MKNRNFQIQNYAGYVQIIDMAFPRKNTRRLSVDGIPYAWHLNKDWDVRARWIVVRREVDGDGQLLMVDPYHHDFLPSKGTITKAVRFALSRGWQPGRKAAPLRLTFAGRERGFQVSTGIAESAA